MRTLDETDLEILGLLVEDARRPYSDIAECVDVSAPTVSDRIDRLQELGVIESFTVDLDRTTFTDGVEVVIDVDLRVHTDERVVERFVAAEQVEHVFETADGRLVAIATVEPDRIRDLLAEAIDLELIDSYAVSVLTDHRWEPTVASRDLALTCEECSEPVTDDGVVLRFDDELYHFCSSSCRSNFEDRRVGLVESR